MDSWSECADCGESYPSVACKYRCPSCGLKQGAPIGSGRKVKEDMRKFRDVE